MHKKAKIFRRTDSRTDLRLDWVEFTDRENLLILKFEQFLMTNSRDMKKKLTVRDGQTDRQTDRHNNNNNHFNIQINKNNQFNNSTPKGVRGGRGAGGG